MPVCWRCMEREAPVGELCVRCRKSKLQRERRHMRADPSRPRAAETDERTHELFRAPEHRIGENPGEFERQMHRGQPRITIEWSEVKVYRIEEG